MTAQERMAVLEAKAAEWSVSLSFEPAGLTIHTPEGDEWFPEES